MASWQLASLQLGFFRDEPMTDAEFDYVFKSFGAIWVRDNSNPLNPHAALTAGGCSNVFANTLHVLSYANLCYILAWHLAMKIRAVYSGQIDWVVGSDHAGAVFSQNVAFFLGARHDFTTKVPKKDGEPETQIWNRFQIGRDEYVLRAEELMTTATTAVRVTNGISAFHDYPIRFIPVIGTCINRSNMTEYEGNKLVSVREYTGIQTFDSPEVCEWCQAGSERILNPKQNLDRLRSIGT